MHRGSRSHILNWVECPGFAAELTRLLEPTGALVSESDQWMPRGNSDDAEARLQRNGADLLPDSVDWTELRRWWLAHNGRANTPNWDLAASCSIRGTRGLVLVEGKAHVEELSDEPKPERDGASWRSRENHQRIGEAIAEASRELSVLVPGVNISRDSHYQLANRVAFSWKLASMGLETVLLYLGFTGDSEVGVGFRDAQHWEAVFRAHVAGVLPAELLEREVDCGPAAFRILVRARPAC